MPETSADTFAAGADGTDIAARDHGGTGTPVVLLHGAGATLRAWDAVAPLLAAEHRVVSMDLRGHGRSGDAPWDEEAVLDDVAAVGAHFGLDHPAVVGHSLGGMVAGRWGARDPECPAVVSLDGHRSAATYPENYVGLEPEELRRDLAELEAMFSAQTRAMAEPLTPGGVEQLLEAQRGAAARLGVPAEPLVEGIRRGLAERDGAAYLRPAPETTEALRHSPGFVDAVPDFWRTRCPFLIVVANRDLPEVPPDLRGLTAAHRRGLHRDLAALAAARPNVRIQEIDAGHAMVAERPQETARLVNAFLAESAAAGQPTARASAQVAQADPGETRQGQAS